MPPRLIKKDWEAIKAQHLAGQTAWALSGLFGVSKATIHSRCSREKWRQESPARHEAPARDAITELTEAIHQLTSAIKETR
ncbi:hypothetical protein [Herbaspirillum sp. NPDC087042]|uniref:hypothetical protein n=1 Tax=Herbaspirillum sp. NPDC087042 TaxID=3364004 RepID=UPI003803E0D9